MSDDAKNQAAFAKLLAVVTELREKCPWDREQKLADTPRHLIEEAYEVADAVTHGKPADIAEELGDVVAQFLFVSVIFAEQSQIDVAKVISQAADKLVRRHPHVYGGASADTVDQVLDNWETIKQNERAKKNPEEEVTGAPKSLRHVGRALPALMRAEKLGLKARRAGMDWANVRDVLAKVREEITEVEHALDHGDTASAAGEIGDMMLAIANAPRFLGYDAEQTLRAACDKFVARFDTVARLAAERGLTLKSMTPAEIEALWVEAKRER